MAVPRPVLIAVLGLALIAGVFVMMHGRSSSGTVTRAPTVTPATPAPHATTTAVKPHSATVRPQPKPAAKKPAPSAQGQLAQVLAALGRGNTAVVFFSQSGSADDAAAAASVAAVQGIANVSVFNAGLNDLAAYRPLLSNTGLSQVPAVVVMRSGRPARLLEGYVDPDTLRQTVADASG